MGKSPFWTCRKTIINRGEVRAREKSFKADHWTVIRLVYKMNRTSHFTQRKGMFFIGQKSFIASVH